MVFVNSLHKSENVNVVFLYLLPLEVLPSFFVYTQLSAADGHYNGINYFNFIRNPLLLFCS